MNCIPTISIEDYICKNCDCFQGGECPVQRLNADKSDMACSQIFEHYNKEE